MYLNPCITLWIVVTLFWESDFSSELEEDLSHDLSHFPEAAILNSFNKAFCTFLHVSGWQHMLLLLLGTRRFVHFPQQPSLSCPTQPCALHPPPSTLTLLGLSSKSCMGFLSSDAISVSKNLVLWILYLKCSVSFQFYNHKVFPYLSGLINNSFLKLSTSCKIWFF